MGIEPHVGRVGSYECERGELQNDLENGWTIKQVDTQITMRNASSERNMFITALLEKED
ncbi:MAG: hypothetical protein J1E16_01880 [Muribaculaceae bacterium]|nr:hypothetical protein [Muribaculaceae bacterium]